MLHLITLRRQVIKSKQAKIYGFLQNAISLRALVKNAQCRLLSKQNYQNSFTNLLYLPPINDSFGFHHLWTALAAFPAVDINKKQHRSSLNTITNARTRQNYDGLGWINYQYNI